MPRKTNGLRINLGCGSDYRPGYINIDKNPEHKHDLLSDVTWLADLEDQSVSEILAQDVLEHVFREQCLTALLEWNRVLAHEGVLLIRVPSLENLLGLFLQSKNQNPEQHAILIQCLFGTQGYEGDFHFNGFTELSLRDQLNKTGFEVQSLTLQHEWLFEVRAIKKVHRFPDPLLRITDNAEFLYALYRRLLRRDIDPGGLSHFTRLLEKGIARESVAKALTNSNEYKKLTTES